jgi:hypothetical protein
MHKNTDLVPQISRWLVPMNDLEDHIPLIATTGSAHMGYNNKKITAGIPKWVKPGRYKIMNVVTYEYFGIRKVNFKYETPCFEVIAPEGKK